MDSETGIFEARVASDEKFRSRRDDSGESMVVLQSYTHLLEREVLYPDADPRGRSNIIKLEYPVFNDKAASLVGLITKARFKVNAILSAIRHIR